MSSIDIIFVILACIFKKISLFLAYLEILFFAYNLAKGTESDFLQIHPVLYHLPFHGLKFLSFSEKTFHVDQMGWPGIFVSRRLLSVHV